MGTKRWSVIFCKEQFWVWHLILYWLWSKNVLGVGFESIGRWLFEKNWFLNAILRLQIFPMTGEADVENVENNRFVSMSCGLPKFTSLREVKIILCPTY